ncbi:MAG: glycosyltransferase [Patescibacteria group bacterium]|nr:glycosyltransferase [Patescibacteria group bacterium]
MTSSTRRRGVFLVWPQEYELSQHLADNLGLRLLLIQAKNPNSPVLFRYFNQSVRTIRWLNKHKPQFVFIQNPPLMACLIVYFYSIFHRQTKIGIDNHSVFFRSKKWVLWHSFFKPIAQRAVINTAHNKYDLRILKQWGVNCQEMQFINPIYRKSLTKSPLKNLRWKRWKKKLKQAKVSVFMVNRFAKDDDDYITVMRAAKRKPNWIFFITGDSSKASQTELQFAPSNVIFTGYLNHSEFLKLMQKCSVTLCLTLRENTILWSIREAMALRKVFVTSDTKALREYFSGVGIFTERRSPKDLIRKIRHAVTSTSIYQEKINLFLKNDSVRIKEEIVEIKKAMGQSL